MKSRSTPVRQPVRFHGPSSQLLLKAGTDPAIGDEGDNGRTPAMATVGYPDMLREILEKKPDLSLTDNFRHTAMYPAVRTAVGGEAR